MAQTKRVPIRPGKGCGDINCNLCYQTVVEGEAEAGVAITTTTEAPVGIQAPLEQQSLLFNAPPPIIAVVPPKPVKIDPPRMYTLDEVVEATEQVQVREREAGEAIPLEDFLPLIQDKEVIVEGAAEALKTRNA